MWPPDYPYRDVSDLKINFLASHSKNMVEPDQKVCYFWLGHFVANPVSKQNDDMIKKEDFLLIYS